MKLVIPIGKSRANIIHASRIEDASEIKLLLTNSAFPSNEDVSDLLSILPTGTGVKWSAARIEGPDEGPVASRDSVLRMLDEGDGFVPDGIFVSASTNLIVAQLRWMFPDSELISLRHFDDGTYLYNLSKGERLSKIEPIEVEEYLSIHGIEIEHNLVFKGQKIPIDEVIMPENSSRLSIRWRGAASKANYLDRYDKKTSPSKKEIGSFVQLVSEHCGPSNFEFLLGPSGGTANWIDPDLVRIGVKWWEEE